MNNIIIEPTNNTPAIDFSINGIMKIKGRSMTENVTSFYTPLIEWAKYVNSSIMKLDINLEYINSASAKKILELLKVLDDNNDINVLNINWYFEHNDHDILESGQIFKELLQRANFQCISYSDDE